MKTKLAKLAKLASFVSKSDRRYIQFAYFVLVLAGFVIMHGPYDGGGGPI